MKFLADMGISPRSVQFLRDLGYEAIHLHEIGLDKMADSQILEKAHQEARVLLTNDLDFSDLLAASRARLPSVVIFRLKDMRPQNVNRYLEEILSKHSKELSEGVICSVRSKRIRVRRLPIK
jgi:predicted nuclease of predicted toxin-antitoxin system